MEMNLDAIVGPSHNYSGLSYGNIASTEHSYQPSNPKKAALQGLQKMYSLFTLGVTQAVLPPHERPFIPILKRLGFTGTDSFILEQTWKTNRTLFLQCCSAASMWAANAATISPSADCYDGKVHFTPANLQTNFHRSFEAGTTGVVLFRIFNHPAHFIHHPSLPYHHNFSDEGAANHTRFSISSNHPGIELFVYGRSVYSPNDPLPKKFPARQTDEASRAIARLHLLNPSRTIFAQQNPEAIDAGVFHSDVISIGHQNLFLFHEKAFLHTAKLLEELNKKMTACCGAPLLTIEVKESEISLSEAVATYLFNSQIVTLPDKTMALIAPTECATSPAVSLFLQKIVENREQPIRKVLFQDVRESMQNGGGPACLRLRVPLQEKEYQAVYPHVLLSEELYQKLIRWVEKHYRDHLLPHDLIDPKFLQEGRVALDELSQILHLGSIYPFQN